MSLCFASADQFVVSAMQRGGSEPFVGWDRDRAVANSSGGRFLRYTHFFNFNVSGSTVTFIVEEGGDWFSVSQNRLSSTTYAVNINFNQNADVEIRRGSFRLRVQLPNDSIVESVPLAVAQLGTGSGFLFETRAIPNGRIGQFGDSSVFFSLYFSGYDVAPRLVGTNDAVDADVAALSSITSTTARILPNGILPNRTGAARAVEYIISFADISEPPPISIEEFSLRPLQLPSQNVTLSGSKKLFFYLRNNNRRLLFNDILLYLNDYYKEPNLEISATELLDIRLDFLILSGETDIGCFVLTHDDCKLIV